MQRHSYDAPEHGADKTNRNGRVMAEARVCAIGSNCGSFICIFFAASSNLASSRPLARLATLSSPKASPKSARIARDNNYDHLDEGLPETRGSNTPSNMDPTTDSSLSLSRATWPRSVLGVGVSKSWVTARDMLSFEFNSEVSSFTRLDFRPMAKKGRSSSKTMFVSPCSSENGVSSPTRSPNRRYNEVITMVPGAGMLETKSCYHEDYGT